jgi:DNA-binding CsgD family transcriptional regulator
MGTLLRLVSGNRIVREGVMAEIVGREAEFADLRAFIEAVPSGTRALVVEGEPGIGKTTLWDSAVAWAEESGLAVLRCRPAESEARMSYSGWMDLLRDVDEEHLDGLPEPQRLALEVALLRSSSGEETVDHRAVSAGALGVLRSLSGRSPVLVAIDDQQWLDPQSVALIEYCARRLCDEPVGFLACGRVLEGRPDPLRLGSSLGEDRSRHTLIGPLPIDAIGLLLVRRLGLTLPYPTIRRIHEAVGGNPFYALEVGRTMLHDPDRWKEHEIPVPSDVRALVRSRIAGLEAGALEMVELSSACARPSAAIVDPVVGPESARAYLAQAEAAGVLAVEGDEVRFVHPLFAAAAYSGMSSDRRRAIHSRLASVVPDAEERARHLALGSEPPDEEVAEALEAEAQRTARRGAPITAAELFEEAVRFTPGDRAGAIEQLSILAADQHFMAGDHPRAIELLEKALASMPPGPKRAEALLRLGRLMFYWDLPRASRLLREAEVQDAPPAALSGIHVMGAWVAWHMLDMEGALAHGREAVRLAEEAGDAEAFVTAVGVTCIIEPMAGIPADRALLDRAVALESSVAFLALTDRASFALASLLRDEGSFAEARDLYRSELAEARERGDEMSVTDMLLNLAELESVAGDWEASLGYAQEMYGFDVQVGYPTVVPASSLATIEGHRGEFDLARAHVAEALDAVRTQAGQGHGTRELGALIAAGTVELAADDPGAASGYLLEAWDRLAGSEIGHPEWGWFLADVAEVLVACGRTPEAAPLAGWLEEKGRGLDDPTALALAARIRGLVAASSGDLAKALVELATAVEYHRRMDVPFERGRTLLVLGTVRRHAKQKAAAREALDEALTIFERLGALPWVERVRAELAAIGGRPAPTGQLTPTEARVARLASAGRTNREIADSLFLSVRTVESHLSHAYAKIGVRSRTELTLALEPPDDST